MSDTPLSLLSRVFGYSEFRGDQAAIVDTLVAGGDALVLMPTGGYFYYVFNSVYCRPVDISGVDDDLSQPMRPDHKSVFQLTPELTGIPTIFVFCKAKRLTAHPDAS
jgi:hypothetical protein